MAIIKLSNLKDVSAYVRKHFFGRYPETEALVAK